MTEPGADSTTQPQEGLSEDMSRFSLSGGSFRALVLLVMLEDREQQNGSRGWSPDELE